MEHRLDEFYETVGEDALGREILKTETGEVHKMYDGIPHTVTAEGEPQASIHNFRLLSIEEQLGYDLGSYPGGFDPELYGLEGKPKK